MWFLLAACSSSPTPSVEKAPVPPAEPKVELSEVRKLDRKPPKANREPVRQAWKKVFPDQEVFICGKPVVIPVGIYQADQALVVVDRGTTQVISDGPGQAPATAEGVTYGELTWSETECRWTGQQLIKATGTVEGGGVHTVLGCPGGERQLTDQDGRFKVQMGSARSCEARVLDVKAMALGEPTALAEGAHELVVKPAVTPLAEAKLAELVELRRKTLQARLDRVSSELARLEGVEDEGKQATWYRGWLAKERPRLEQELAHVDTDAGKVEALARHL